MHRRATWEEVLRNCPKTGSQIELQKGFEVSRGPIEKIEVRENDIFFHLVWCAHYDVGTEKWTVADSKRAFIFKQSETTVDLGTNGRVLIMGPHITAATVFPVGDEELKPEDVIDLDPNNPPKAQYVEIP